MSICVKTSPSWDAKCGQPFNLKLLQVGPPSPIQLESTAARIIAPILVALTMGAFTYMWFYGGPPLLFLLAVLAHGGFGTWYRSRVKGIKSSFEAHAREFTILQSTLERLERENVSSPLLQELRGEFGSASTEDENARRVHHHARAAKERNGDVPCILPVVGNPDFLCG